MTPRLYFINRYAWPDESATAQMLTDLTEGLAAARRGRFVGVVASQQRLDQPSASLKLRELRQGVLIQRIWTTSFGRDNLLGRAFDYASFYVSAALFVLLHVRRGDTVVAMTDPPLLGAVIGWAVRWKGAHLVNWWQDVYPDIAVRLGVLRPEGALTRALSGLRNALLRDATRHVAVGESMARRLGDVEKRAAPITVIPNWSPDFPWTPAPAPENPYRKQLRVGSKVLFAYSGNLGRAHPYGPLLAAGERLRDRADLHFVFIGSGANWVRARADADRIKLMNWSFLSYQPRENLAESLGAADVHLITLTPGLEDLIVPSKLYGILAVGRPALFVGSPRGDVAKLLESEGCGIAVDPDEAGSVERAINLLAEDAELRKTMGARARKLFETRYAAAISIRRWGEVLAEPPSLSS